VDYYFKKTLSMDFEDVIEKVTEELKKQGFGVLTEIDVTDTLKEKLHVDFRKYRILGACNPPFAYKALQCEDNIGLMLPCNVIVQEISPRKVEVAAIDPIASMQAIKNPELVDVAKEVQYLLKKVIDNL
jgi:uncharacterized protein (DUF302 family)